MAIPVISTITSLQSWLQYQPFTFQPFATNSPTIWDSSPLPAGLSLDIPTEYATTGVAATDVITATGSAFPNRQPVIFRALTGGSGLVIDTIYYMRDVSGATGKLALTAGGAAINFTTDISAATLTKVPTGAISGTPTAAGAWDVSLVAINASGSSVALIFPIGIAPNSGSLHAGIDLSIDLQTGEVSGGGADFVFAAKSGDTQLFFVTFKQGGVVVDLGTLTNFQFGLKQRDTEVVIVLGGGTGLESPPLQLKTGSGTSTIYLMSVTFTSDGLSVALSDEENDDGTSFIGLGEFTWTAPNATGCGPVSMTRSSLNCRVKLEREQITS